jgi:hypothetical protein
VSDYLYASSFGFSIPAGSTILGVEADIERRRTGGATGQARDSIVRLVDDTGTIVGTNDAYTASNWPTTEAWACDAPGCYGGAADLWGTTLSAAEVNDPDFGLVLAVTGSIAGTDRIAEVDRMELRIYYQGPGGAIESVSAYHGALTNGPQRVPGKVGQALDFFPNGADTNAYVDVGDPGSGALDFGSGDITMSAWVNVRSHVSQGSCCNFILGKYSAASGAAPGYGLFFASDGLPQVSMHDGTNDGNQIGTTNIIGTGWHHIVGVRSGTTVTLYVDSVVEDSGSVPGLGSTSNADPLLIGTTVNADERNINGAVDDVRIYNRALSAAEVKTIYNEGVGTVIGKSQANKVSNGLVGYWSFNGPDFTDKVYDRSGQGNHGYVYGGATSTMKAPGRVGQGLVLNGVNQFQQGGENQWVDIVADGFAYDLDRKTVTAWIKPRTTGYTGFAEIFTVINTNNAIGGWQFLLCDDDATECPSTPNTLYFYQYFDGDNGGWYASANAIKLNEWNHVAVTYDRTSTSNDPTFYVNGQIVATNESATPTGSAAQTVGQYIMIGQKADEFSDTFDGTLDEVRVYDRVLSPAEIKQLYNLGR